MHEAEKSDLAIVAVKPANNSGRPDAEWVERRAWAEWGWAAKSGPTAQQRTHRAQDRASVSQRLDRIRKAAREKKQAKFIALLHHVDVPMLRTAFYALSSTLSKKIALFHRLPGMQKTASLRKIS
jgi:hypothetical protein